MAVPPERATLEVVAARAGVSRATASRVLRGAPRVSARTRDAVLRAAQEMAYVPNQAARALATRRADAVAFVVAEVEDRLFSDPFFLPVMRAAQAETMAAGRQLTFVVASTAGQAAQFEQYAAAGHVDAVLLVSLHGVSSLPRRLEAAGVPTVLAGRPLSGADELSWVDVDNAGGAAQAARLLIERGCRHPVTVAGPSDMSAGRDRLAGFRDALAAAGATLSDDDVAIADFTAGGAEAAMALLVGRRPELDAVFVASDLMARGALRALRSAGRSVPDDVAVVGFDDSPEAALSRPSLTSIRQPLDELGRAMARLASARIDERDTARHLVLPTDVVRRESA